VSTSNETEYLFMGLKTGEQYLPAAEIDLNGMVDHNASFGTGIKYLPCNGL
jgi:hypothetical protein